MKSKMYALLLGIIAVLISVSVYWKNNRPVEEMYSAGEGGNADVGTAYIINFKPEVASEWETLAAKYHDETGRDIQVRTYSSDSYAAEVERLKSGRMRPVLVQTSGYDTLELDCTDLTKTFLYESLNDKSMAISDGQYIYAVPYTVEGYGIIYNNAIMEKYFALPDKAVSINSADEIKSFEILSDVVKDMDKHKNELGIEGVFSSLSLKSGEVWRWTTHLMNIPIYYEMEKDGSTATDFHFDFDYSEQYKNIFDLYLNYGVRPVSELANVDTATSMTEFASGKSAMVQNGNWSWNEISANQSVDSDDIKLLPIYMGIPEEENSGLCIGTEAYWYIAGSSNRDDQAATLEFTEWLLTSKTGKTYFIDKFGNIPTFNTFTLDELPDNPLAQEIFLSMSDGSVKNIPWVFTQTLSEDMKSKIGIELTAYAYGEINWEELKTNIVEYYNENSAASSQKAESDE